MRAAPLVKPITFLSDYGDEDEFAGVCRAVIRQIAPGRAADRHHPRDRPPGDPPRGAGARRRAALRAARRCTSPSSTRGSGPSRRPVAVTTSRRSRFLVGPDNGLLAPAIERFGGAAEAVDICALALPARARLGDLPRARPVRSGRGPPRPRREARRGRRDDRPGRARRAGLCRARGRGRLDYVAAHSLYADRFGNVVLDASRRPAAAAGLLAPGSRIVARARRRRPLRGRRRTSTFGDVRRGRPPLYEDSIAPPGARRQQRQRRAALLDLHPRLRGRARGPSWRDVRRARTTTSRLTDSTNARARELAETARRRARSSPPTSRRGRGRQGRSWFARPGLGAPLLGDLRPLGDPARCCRSPCRLPSARRPRRWPPSSARSSGPTTSGSRTRKLAGDPDRGPVRPRRGLGRDRGRAERGDRPRRASRGTARDGDVARRAAPTRLRSAGSTREARARPGPMDRRAGSSACSRSSGGRDALAGRRDPLDGRGRAVARRARDRRLGPSAGPMPDGERRRWARARST